MKKPWRLRLLLAASVIPLHSGAAEPISMHAHTKAGQEVRTRYHVRNDGQCHAAAVRIVWKKPPAHGHVEDRAQEVVVGINRLGSNNTCKGLSLPGVAVYYMPDAGFRGDDEFIYDVEGAGGTLTYDTVVSVP